MLHSSLPSFACPVYLHPANQFNLVFNGNYVRGMLLNNRETTIWMSFLNIEDIISSRSTKPNNLSLITLPPVLAKEAI